MSNSTQATGASGNVPGEPRYAPDEDQPQAFSNELNALTEREDGTIRAGKTPQDFPGGAPPNAVAIIKLTADEHQSVDAISESRALSEREDGTNIG